MNVVITGSTRGIGLGMAQEFLKRSHNVVISSRHPDAVNSTVAELSARYPSQSVAGTAVDVSDYDQVQRLWDESIKALGTVDMWVNNAGTDTVNAMFDELPPEDIAKTVNTNLLGLMNCNRVAIPGMNHQGSGWIFNMEGFGSDGRVLPKKGPYGATKYAVRYFTKSMIRECENAPVNVGYLSPGIVVTDLLVPPPGERGEQWERTKQVLNILADTVDTVTPFLVEGMLAADKNGTAVRWLTTGKIAGRFMMSRFRKRDVFGPLGL